LRCTRPVEGQPRHWHYRHGHGIIYTWASGSTLAVQVITEPFQLHVEHSVAGCGSKTDSYGDKTSLGLPDSEARVYPAVQCQRHTTQSQVLVANLTGSLLVRFWFASAKVTQHSEPQSHLPQRIHFACAAEGQSNCRKMNLELLCWCGPGSPRTN
jgi:hypothetical protein